MKFLLSGLLTLLSLQAFATDRVEDYIQLESGTYKTNDSLGRWCVYTVAQSADKKELYVGIGSSGKYTKCREAGSYVYKAITGVDGNNNYYEYENFGISLISKNSLYLGDTRRTITVYTKEYQTCEDKKKPLKD